VHLVPLTIPDPILKASMATSKDYIPRKSLSSYFFHCVRHLYYFRSHM
jgi:hypothetical protein